MTVFSVIGDDPDNGPSLKDSESAAANINKVHPEWRIEMWYDGAARMAFFKSETAPPDNLEQALMSQFPKYHVSKVEVGRASNETV